LLKILVLLMLAIKFAAIRVWLAALDQV